MFEGDNPFGIQIWSFIEKVLVVCAGMYQQDRLLYESYSKYRQRK